MATPKRKRLEATPDEVTARIAPRPAPPAKPAEEAPPPNLLPKATVAKQINDIYNGDITASKRIRETRRELWDLYVGDFDEVFKGKLPHQSKHTLPTLSQSVDTLATSLVKWLTSGRDDWMDFTPQDKAAEVCVPIIKRLWKYNAQQESFTTGLEECLKAGLLTNPIYKIYPLEDGTQPYNGYCRIEPVDARYFLRDANGLNGHCCQICVMYAEQLVRDAVQYGYDVNEVRQVLNEGRTGAASTSVLGTGIVGSSPADQVKWVEDNSKVLGFNVATNYHNLIILVEYWGPFWDASKQMQIPFGRAVLANGRVVLMDPEPDPFGTGVLPFVDDDIVKTPFSAFSKPPMQDCGSLTKAQVHAFNMMLDNISDAASYLRVVYSKLLTVASQAKLSKTGAVPGLTLYADGDPGAGNPIATYPLGVFNPAILDIFELLKQEAMSAAALPDTVRGVASSYGAAKTLGQEQIMQKGAGMALEGITTGVEKRVLEPVGELWKTTMINRLDLMQPEVQAIVRQELQDAVNIVMTAERIQYVESMLAETGRTAPPGADLSLLAPDIPEGSKLWVEGVKRVGELMRSRFTVSVTGISHVLTQAQTAADLAAYLEDLEARGGGELIDIIKYARIAAKLAGIRPDEVLKDGWERLELAQTMGAQPLAPSDAPQEPNGNTPPPERTRGPRVRKSTAGVA